MLFRSDESGRPRAAASERHASRPGQRDRLRMADADPAPPTPPPSDHRARGGSCKRSAAGRSAGEGLGTDSSLRGYTHLNGVVSNSHSDWITSGIRRPVARAASSPVSESAPHTPADEGSADQQQCRGLGHGLHVGGRDGRQCRKPVGPRQVGEAAQNGEVSGVARAAGLATKRSWK